ncbi:unnamed protein product [Lepeophtheirus salmonis]|uniref:(salmon louse) hypothetical protein n=1 Tax=Lepeophtheirus salmonis TaxID=72036 RepID=A0A7R8H4L6_LEPSM|nr:unnamed protein product [Lepeophtheirus salmonis]CAF2861553.1 unnamed protein product [Lepeophtheirus salmonis]
MVSPLHSPLQAPVSKRDMDVQVYQIKYPCPLLGRHQLGVMHRIRYSLAINAISDHVQLCKARRFEIYSGTNLPSYLCSPPSLPRSTRESSSSQRLQLDYEGQNAIGVEIFVKEEVETTQELYKKVISGDTPVRILPFLNRQNYPQSSLKLRGPRAFK